ncbi:MAG: ribonuclease R [Breznakibacter sp.]
MSKEKSKGSGSKKADLMRTIQDLFVFHSGRSFNYKQIAGLLGLNTKADRIMIQEVLSEMAFLGTLNESIAGKYRLIVTPSHIAGRVDMTASGSAYIVPADGSADVFVSQVNLNKALHGDKVEVAVFAQKKGRSPEGEVVKIVERKRDTFVGVVEISKSVAFLVTDARTTGGHDIYIPLNALNGAQHGQKAVARITDWPERAKNPIGEIVDVLGFAGDNQTEMHAILAEFGLPYSYPEEIAREAEKIEPGITPDEVAKRRDMRDITTFTIDPVDAKDFDDALSIRRLENGHWEVGVHIADVTHYVTPGTIIDQEGYNRATSVYLVDRVVPMLPERLSNFICSLRPDEEKLTFSVVFEMTDKGDVVGSWVGRTVIKSNRRFSYEEAQEIIETGEGDYKDDILLLDRLAKTLREKRFQAGAIGFERVEVRFEVDGDGRPLSVFFKESKDAHKLVEEFMLMANRRVAELIGKNELENKREKEPKTFVYRIHDEPNPEKYDTFATFVRKFGYEAMPQGKESLSSSLNRLLASVVGKGEQNVIETLAIRTMAKAVYSTHNIGHYGLAFKYYTHFTSPIRRYPDMMVHRLLQQYLDGGKSANAEEYEEMCEHSSKREQLAADAERSSIKYKQVEYMKDHVGQEFDAVISGVTEWGLYAEIIENKCEGMIPIRDLEDDFYRFDEDNFCIVGERSRKTFQLGDAITIRIAKANLDRKQLDFTLASSPIRTAEEQMLRDRSRKPGNKHRGSAIPPKKVLNKVKGKKAKAKSQKKKK